MKLACVTGALAAAALTETCTAFVPSQSSVGLSALGQRDDGPAFAPRAPPTGGFHFNPPSMRRQQQERKDTGVKLAAAGGDADMDELRFLTPETAESVRSMVGTPAYVYSLPELRSNAKECLAFPNAYGLTVRFAMKSCPNIAILQVLHSMGLHIDASSGYEVQRAIHAGIPAENISLSTQELPSDFAALMKLGVKINACSISQVQKIAEACPGSEVGIRFNPGLGSGGTGKTNVGGPTASFGIWYELLPQVKELVEKGDLKVVRVHTHIGSGSDPAIWQKVSNMSLDLCKEFPSVHTLNLGGGYKVGRMKSESSTDLQTVGQPVMTNFEDFKRDTGRELALEIEPGTFMVANVGSLVCTIQDKVTTGEQGHTFLKLDAGMTEVLRPALYGALHPLVVVPSVPTSSTEKCVVVGHCCESGDLLTPKAGAPDDIEERTLTESQIGDLLVVEGCGAYVSSMSTKNYNSFPEAPELALDGDGQLHIVRKKQELPQIWENEVRLPDSLV